MSERKKGAMVVMGCDLYNGTLTGDKAATVGANSHPGSYTGQDAFNNMLPVICNYSGGGISATIDASYYKGAGSRNGKEREFVAILKEVCTEKTVAR